MKKIKFLFIALIMTISLASLSNIIYADETENTQKKEYDEKTEKQEILVVINEYLTQIDGKIKDIDNKLANLKIQKEFEYYPAIRLNIDAPIFGITSIIDNKLRVKRDISTTDVAEKYSIKYIVKNNKIRIPDSYLGAIVMSTREYEINENMTLPQIKLTLVKCIQYLSQVNSVEEYIDTQTNNIFRDYISDEKKASIKSIKDRNSKLTTQLNQMADKIKKAQLMGRDMSNIVEEYNTLTLALNDIKDKVKNTLILDDALSLLTKDSLESESNIIDLQAKVDKEYENALLELDYELYLTNLNSDYKTRVDTMDEYIKEGSKTIKKIVDGKEVEETKVIYGVTSNVTLDYLKQNKKDAKSILDSLKEEKDTKEDVATENKEETQPKKKTKEELAQERQELLDENGAKVDTLYSKYKDSLNREHRFYTSNVNMLLKDSNDKVSSVISQIDSGISVDNEIFNYTKYIYIELPENLEKNINRNNIDSILELDSLIKSLRKELNTLCTKNIEINKLYNEILEKSLES